MSGSLPPLASLPPWVVSLGDYEMLARERISESAWAYITGGAADELTLRRNREAFDRLLLNSRILADVRGGSTRLTLFGQTYASPILLAPVAYLKLAHPEGEAAAALGARATETGFVLSTHASLPLEAVATAAGPIRPWFQLYAQPQRAATESLIRRAQAAGYSAIVVTLDAPVNGVRNREQRAGFALPPGVEAVNTQAFQAQPPYKGGAGQPLCGGIMEHALTWEDLGWLRKASALPLLLKGVMHPEDAAKALDAGADGLIVSNHGGRTLDTMPATIEVLPSIVARVAGKAPVLLDGGIRRGTDVLKALALGADAVLVGRPYVHGLAAAGATGVAHVVNILRSELEVAMALTGCRDLEAIGPGVVWDPAARQ